MNEVCLMKIVQLHNHTQVPRAPDDVIAASTYVAPTDGEETLL